MSVLVKCPLLQLASIKQSHFCPSVFFYQLLFRFHLPKHKKPKKYMCTLVHSCYSFKVITFVSLYEINIFGGVILNNKLVNQVVFVCVLVPLLSVLLSIMVGGRVKASGIRSCSVPVHQVYEYTAFYTPYYNETKYKITFSTPEA